MNKIKNGLVVAILITIIGALYIFLFTSLWIPEKYLSVLGLQYPQKNTYPPLTKPTLAGGHFGGTGVYVGENCHFF